MTSLPPFGSSRLEPPLWKSSSPPHIWVFVSVTTLVGLLLEKSSSNANWLSVAGFENEEDVAEKLVVVVTTFELSLPKPPNGSKSSNGLPVLATSADPEFVFWNKHRQTTGQMTNSWRLDHEPWLSFSVTTVLFHVRREHLTRRNLISNIRVSS